MPVHNADIARVFEDIADLLEISAANAFRVRAYRNAARTVGDLRLDLAAAIAAGKDLPKLPGIGADLDAKIHEIAGTGAHRESAQEGLGERLREVAKANPALVGEILQRKLKG